MAMTGIARRAFASWIVPSDGVSPPRNSAEHSSTRSAPPCAAPIASSIDPQQISRRTFVIGYVSRVDAPAVAREIAIQGRRARRGEHDQAEAAPGLAEHERPQAEQRR